MKILICIISLTLLFFQSGFACTVDIWTIKTAAVQGKVIDEYKNPIPNAAIQIYKNKEEGIEILAETRADENGKFEIKNFQSGKYMIRANAGNFAYSYAFMKLKSKPSASGGGNSEIIFTLVPNSACSGKVEVRKISKTK